MALDHGLDGELLKDMTVGNVVDYIIESNEIHSERKGNKNKEKIRTATQDDFDNF